MSPCQQSSSTRGLRAVQGPRHVQVTPSFSSLRGPQDLLRFAFHSGPRARVFQRQPCPLSCRPLDNMVASSHTVPSLSFSLQVVALESAIPPAGVHGVSLCEHNPVSLGAGSKLASLRKSAARPPGFWAWLHYPELCGPGQASMLQRED